jgi:hypothetical protein
LLCHRRRGSLLPGLHPILPPAAEELGLAKVRSINSALAKKILRFIANNFAMIQNPKETMLFSPFLQDPFYNTHPDTHL